jgi:hypothetical protein
MTMHGYDGQFFYRLALEPFSTAERVDGIAFDAPAYRQQRIGYPLLAFLTTALTPALHRAIAGHRQRGGGRGDGLLRPLASPSISAGPRPSPCCCSPGPPSSSLSASTCPRSWRPPSSSAGFDSPWTQQHGLAVLFLSGAVLTRETTALVAVAALFVYRRWIYAWVLGVIASWEVTVWAMWGEIPGMTSLPAPGERLLGFPLVGLVEGAQRWGVIDLAVGVALLVVMWIGASHFRKGTLAGTAFLGSTRSWPSAWAGRCGRAGAASHGRTVELIVLVFVLRLAPSTATDDYADQLGVTAQDAAVET